VSGHSVDYSAVLFYLAQAVVQKLQVPRGQGMVVWGRADEAQRSPVEHCDMRKLPHVAVLQVFHELPTLEEQRADLEDEALLAPVRQGELDLAVQAPGAQQGGVQGVCAVGGHDHFHVHRLIKPIHLQEAEGGKGRENRQPRAFLA